MHIVIGMDYAIARIYYSSGIGNFYRSISFFYSVYCLPHYFRFSLNGTSAQIVFFKHIIAHRIVYEKTFYICNRIENVL